MVKFVVAVLLLHFLQCYSPIVAGIANEIGLEYKSMYIVYIAHTIIFFFDARLFVMRVF